VDDLRDERQVWQVAAAVCAMANSPAGGIVVCRARADHPTDLPSPSDGHDAVARVADLLQQHLFPPPTDLGIEQVPISAAHGATLGHVVISLPPQDVDIKPFLAYDVGADAANEFQALAIVERRGVTIQRQSVSATHAQLVAGRALLRGRRAAE
jgi:hypothetical protein